MSVAFVQVPEVTGEVNFKSESSESFHIPQLGNSLYHTRLWHLRIWSFASAKLVMTSPWVQLKVFCVGSV